MTQNDSFIHEVTEEVRRDKLFAIFKKYGWVFAGLIVLVVGGAGANEWLKARAQRAAEATGDAMMAAISLDDKTAQAAEFAKIAAASGKAAVLVKFQLAASLQQAGLVAGAVDVLAEIARSADTTPLMQDMARLKSVMMQGKTLAAADRLAVLDPLSQPGGKFRMLALEQRALVNIESGNIAAALTDLMTIFESAESSQSSQQRAGQLIVALGGELPQAEPVKVQ